MAPTVIKCIASIVSKSTHLWILNYAILLFEATLIAFKNLILSQKETLGESKGWNAIKTVLQLYTVKSPPATCKSSWDNA